jgi:hypothetical protein
VGFALLLVGLGLQRLRPVAAAAEGARP